MTLLRAAALIAIPVGAVGSIGLFLRQAERAPLLIVIGFIFWMLSPFALLVWAVVAAKRWSLSARATVYSLALLIALASIAVYARAVDVAPPGSANAFRFVAVAPASWLLIAIVIPLAALASRRGA
jgi:hypothetical protein